jgi:SAM-dependent methyltransferase
MSYHATRFQYDRRRTIVWRELIRYLERRVPFGDTVLDIGCGYGEFINNVKAPKRFALDVSPEQRKYMDPSVSFLTADVMTVGDAFPPSTFDFIFSSNLLEHLERAEIGTLLGILRTLLRPGGYLGILMPNYRLKPHLYFDDYTHKTAVSDVALCDWMASKGFEVVLSKPGFMPYSMRQSGLPVSSLLVRCWLWSPVKPGAGQMLVIGRRPPSSL